MSPFSLPRTVRITPHGRRFLLLTVALGVAAVNTGNNLLYLLLGMLLSLLTVSGLLSDRMMRKLSVARQVPEIVSANQPTPVALTVRNGHGWLPCWSLHLEDRAEVPGNAPTVRVMYVPPHGTVTRTYPFLAHRRGWYRFRGIRITTRFPFGLFTRSVWLPADHAQLVYPAMKALSGEIGWLVPRPGDQSGRKGPGEGHELYQVRDYQPGEDPRRIHWKISARQGRLMIKETQNDSRQQLTMVLPTRGRVAHGAHGDGCDSRQAFEQAVERAASIVKVLVKQDYRFRAIVGRTEVPYGSGMAQFHVVMRVLAACGIEDGNGAGDAFSRAFRDVGQDRILVILPWPRTMPPAACSDRCAVIQGWDGP